MGMRARCAGPILRWRGRRICALCARRCRCRSVILPTLPERKGCIRSMVCWLVVGDTILPLALLPNPQSQGSRRLTLGPSKVKGLNRVSKLSARITACRLSSLSSSTFLLPCEPDPEAPLLLFALAGAPPFPPPLPLGADIALLVLRDVVCSMSR